MKVNFEEKQWRNITIKRGQFITSLGNLALETGLSVRQVRTSLNKLNSTSEVTSIGTSEYTIITILNYNEYQDSDKQVDKQMTNERQTNDKQMTTTKEYKNEKEVYIHLNEKQKQMLSDRIEKWKGVKLTDPPKKQIKDWVERISRGENVLA